MRANKNTTQMSSKLDRTVEINGQLLQALDEIALWRGLAEQNKDDALLTITRIAILATKKAREKLT